MVDVRRRRARGAAALVALTVASGCRTAVPTPAGEGGVEAQVVHAWDARLAEVVDEAGLVDYAALAADRTALDDYLAWLAEPRGGFNRENDRYGFWINAYNSLVLHSALHAGPPESVLDVPGWLPKPGAAFFLEQTHIVDGRPISLSEIEHERLRMRVYDPRIHGALNCASRSCPPLRAGLYEQRASPDAARRLERQLDEQMSRWLTDPERGVRIEGDTVVFSQIFEWFERDFIAWTPAPDVCAAASAWAPALREPLEAPAAAGCPHRFAPYDWSLNGQ